MEISNIVREAVQERVDVYRTCLKACRSDPSEPAVHDLRAALRRLLAALDMADYLLPAWRGRKLVQGLKEQLDILDDLRDVQVILAVMPDKVHLFPELEALQDSLEQREQKLSRAAKKTLRELDAGRIQQQLERVDRGLQDAEAGGLPEEAMRAIDDSFFLVMQHDRDVDPAQPASLHQVRIAFRKFRYMLEMIQGKLRGLPEDYFERIRGYQTRLGAFQDAVVFLDVLERFAAHQNDYDPLPARQFFEGERDKALSAYLEQKDEIGSFWRRDPQAELPWRSRRVEEGIIPMNIYIVRHAIAVEPGTPGYEDDSLRPLTTQGRKKMKKIARGLREFGVELDHILTSPYVRARDTAEILAATFNLKKQVAFSDHLIPPGDFQGLVREIREKYDVDNLALVGHEPMLSQFTSWLLTGSGGTPITLKKGGVCLLSAENLGGQGDVRLQWLFTPAAMIALAG